MKSSKPEFRYKYYKDLVALLLTISSGLGAAFVGFLVSLNSPRSKGLAIAAILLILISVVLGLISSFFAYIGSGSFWDAENARRNDDRSSWERFTDDQLLFGKVTGFSLLIQIPITIAWLIIMTLFVLKNI